MIHTKASITSVLPLWSLPEIQVDLLWVLSGFFAAFGALFFSFVFYSRNQQKQLDRRIRERRSRLAPMISSFLFYEEEQGREEQAAYIAMKIEVRDLLRDPVNRRVFSEILQDLEKDLSGDTRRRLLGLYQNLGLHLDAFDRLQSRRWEVVSKAILELSGMEVGSAYSFIRPFINHRRSAIRKQAQLAAVSLNREEGIAYFLDNARHEISEWQQIALLDELRQFDDFVPPKFRVWLTSRNRDVVLFALRLIRYYKQNDAAAAIIQLLRHKEDKVKLEALGCIREFGLFQALPGLKDVFWSTRPEVRMQVLDAIGFLGSEKELPFLETVLAREKHFLVKNKAIASINAIEPDRILPEAGIALKTSDMTVHHDLSAEGETEPNRPLETAATTSEHEEDWDSLLQQEEDLEIFDLCLQESLDELLEDTAAEDSLEFLPYVAEETETGVEEPSAGQELEAMGPSLSAAELHALKEMELRYELVEGTQTRDLSEQMSEDELSAMAYMQSIYELLGDDVMPAPGAQPLSEKEEELIGLLLAPETEEGAAMNELPPQNTVEISEFEVVDHVTVISPAPEVLPDWEVDLELRSYGIFQELFEKADREARFILLKEILEVGEERDLLYLRTLDLRADARLAAALQQSIQKLQDRMEERQRPTPATAEPGSLPVSLDFDPGFQPEFPATADAHEKTGTGLLEKLQHALTKWHG